MDLETLINVVVHVTYNVPLIQDTKRKKQYESTISY